MRITACSSAQPRRCMHAVSSALHPLGPSSISRRRSAARSAHRGSGPGALPPSCALGGGAEEDMRGCYEGMGRSADDIRRCVAPGIRGLINTTAAPAPPGCSRRINIVHSALDPKTEARYNLCRLPPPSLMCGRIPIPTTHLPLWCFTVPAGRARPGLFLSGIVALKDIGVDVAHMTSRPGGDARAGRRSGSSNIAACRIPTTNSCATWSWPLACPRRSRSPFSTAA